MARENIFWSSESENSESEKVKEWDQDQIVFIRGKMEDPGNEVGKTDLNLVIQEDKTYNSNLSQGK